MLTAKEDVNLDKNSYRYLTKKRTRRHFPCLELRKTALPLIERKHINLLNNKKKSNCTGLIFVCFFLREESKERYYPSFKLQTDKPSQK